MKFAKVKRYLAGAMSAVMIFSAMPLSAFGESMPAEAEVTAEIPEAVQAEEAAPQTGEMAVPADGTVIPEQETDSQEAAAISDASAPEEASGGEALEEEDDIAIEPEEASLEELVEDAEEEEVFVEELEFGPEDEMAEELVESLGDGEEYEVNITGTSWALFNQISELHAQATVNGEDIAETDQNYRWKWEWEAYLYDGKSDTWFPINEDEIDNWLQEPEYPDTEDKNQSIIFRPAAGVQGGGFNIHVKLTLLVDGEEAAHYYTEEEDKHYDYLDVHFRSNIMEMEYSDGDYNNTTKNDWDEPECWVDPDQTGGALELYPDHWMLDDQPDSTTYELEWYVGVWDDELQKPVKVTKEQYDKLDELFTISDDGRRMFLDMAAGLEMQKHFDQDAVYVHADIEITEQGEGNEIKYNFWSDTWVHFREPEYELYYPYSQPGEETLLINRDNLHFEAFEQECTVWNADTPPWGEYRRDVEISDLKIIKQGPHGNDEGEDGYVAAELRMVEDGYEINPVDHGWFEISYTLTIRDNEGNVLYTEDVNSNTPGANVRFYVCGDRFDFGSDTDNQTNRLLPGGDTLMFHTNLQYVINHDDWDEWFTIDDYELEIEGYDGNLIEVEVVDENEDDTDPSCHGILVTSKDRTGGTPIEIKITGTNPDNNERFEQHRRIYVDVTDDYYYMEIGPNGPDPSQALVGESFDLDELDLLLWHSYVEEGEQRNEPVDKDEYRLELDYERDYFWRNWAIDEEPDEGNGRQLPSMIRLDSGYSEIPIKAWIDNGPDVDYRICFDDLEYNVKITKGGNENFDNRLFSDDSMTLKTKTEGIDASDYQNLLFDWEVVTWSWDGEVPVDDYVYQIRGNEIILDGEEMYSFLENYGPNFAVRIRVCNGDENYVLCENEYRMRSEEAEWKIYDAFGDDRLFPNDTRDWDTYFGFWVRNANVPDGGDVRAKITDIVCVDEDPDPYDVRTAASAVHIEEDDGRDYWQITGNHFGRTVATITYKVTSSPGNIYNGQEFSWDVELNVNGDQLDTEMAVHVGDGNTGRDYDNCHDVGVVPGDVITLRPEYQYSWYDQDTLRRIWEDRQFGILYELEYWHHGALWEDWQDLEQEFGIMVDQTGDDLLIGLPEDLFKDEDDSHADLRIMTRFIWLNEDGSFQYDEDGNPCQIEERDMWLHIDVINSDLVLEGWDEFAQKNSPFEVDHKLYIYRNEDGTNVTEEILEPSEYYLVWEFEDNRLKIEQMVDGEPVQIDPDEDVDPSAGTEFRITRLDDDGNLHGELVAYSKDEDHDEIARMGWHFNDRQFWTNYQGARDGGGYTWVYTDGLDQDLDLSIDPSEIEEIAERDDFRLEVSYGYVDDQDDMVELEKGVYTYGQGGFTLQDQDDYGPDSLFTIGQIGADWIRVSSDDFEGLCDQMRSAQEDDGIDENEIRNSMRVEADFYLGEVLVGGAEVKIDFRGAWSRMEDDGVTIVSGDRFYYPDGRIYYYEESGRFPFGAEGDLTISDIKSSDNYTLYPQDKTEEEDGCWYIEALQSGEAEITYTASGSIWDRGTDQEVELGEVIHTTTLRADRIAYNVYFTDRRYEFVLLPGEKMRLPIELHRYTKLLPGQSMEEGDAIVPEEEYEISFPHHDWNDRILQVDDDGNSDGYGTIQALVPGRTQVTVEIHYHDDEDRDFRVQLRAQIDVTSSYGTLDLGQEFFYVTPGLCIAAEELYDMVNSHYSVVSMNNPEGDDTENVGTLWFGDGNDQLDYYGDNTGDDVGEGMFQEFWVHDDIMELARDREETYEDEGCEFYETWVSIGARNEDGGNEAWGDLRLIVHEHDDNSMLHHAAKAPSGSAKGSVEYWECDICGRMYADKEAQTEVTEDDLAAANTAYDAIMRLNPNADVSDEAAVNAASASYQGLGSVQKALVGSAAASRLTSAKSSLQKANNAVADALSKINALNPSAPNEAAAKAARAAYDALSSAQKAKIGSAALSRLTSTESAVKAAKEKAAAGPARLVLNIAAGTKVPLKTKQKCSKIVVEDIAPDDAIASAVSSNEKAVTVTWSGMTINLKAGKKTGKSDITIKTKRGASVTFKVQVQKKKVTAKKIAVASTTVNLKVGDTFDLKTVVTPISTPDKIKYTSSKKKIAAVKNGIITAKKAGTAKITVKVGKKTKKITVKVTG